MSCKVLTTSRFDRQLKKLKKDPELQGEIIAALEELELDGREIHGVIRLTGKNNRGLLRLAVTGKVPARIKFQFKGHHAGEEIAVLFSVEKRKENGLYDEASVDMGQQALSRIDDAWQEFSELSDDEKNERLGI